MLIYLIKSGLCLLVLFSFYKLFLENEQFHGIKRIYLLGAILISFCLPFITITYGVEYVDTSNYNNEALIYNNVNSERASDNLSNYLFYILLGLYFTGFSFFAFRFGRNLNLLVKEAKENERLKKLSYIFVLVGRAITPHSFFNYIFLSKSEYQDKRISSAVIEHEKAHVDQKHSLDILLVELLQVIFWFNPLFIWIKNSIKLNHEFLADKEVLSKKFNALEYSNILFNYSSGYHHNSLSSPINHSLIKKRIIMITKDFSLKKLLTRIGLFIPILGCCIFFFNNEIEAKTIYKRGETSALIEESSIPVDTKIGDSEIELQQPELKIKVEGENLWVNAKSVKIDDFAKEVDAFTSNLSEEKLRDLNIQMKINNSNESFREYLDKEFARTRLAKITGRSILPPPPPLPPAVDRATPPPPAPVVGHDVHIDNAHRERAREWKKMKDTERKMIAEQRERIRVIEKELQQDKKLTQVERAKMQADLRKKEVEIHRKMREIEKNRREIEREHKTLEREQMLQEPPMPPSPPSVPTPQEPSAGKDLKVLTEDVKNVHGKTVKTIVSQHEIESKYPENAVYYLNDKEISRKKALKLIKEKKPLQVDIRKSEDGNDIVKIYT